MFLGLEAIVSERISAYKQGGVWLTGIDAIIGGIWYWSFIPLFSYMAYIQYYGRWKLMFAKPYKALLLANIALILALGLYTVSQKNKLVDEYIENYGALHGDEN